MTSGGGEEDRWRRFLATDYARVVGVVTLVCADRSVAEDAVQDAVVSTWTRRDDPDHLTATQLLRARAALAGLLEPQGAPRA